ncbi:MAG: 3'-5' exonuclease, partial [Patescibacteria group bacterium]
ICIVQGCVGSGKSTVAIHKLSHIFFNYPELIHPERSILIAKNQILVGYLSTLFPKLGIFNINYKTLKDLVYNSVFREKYSIRMDFNLENFGPEVTLDRINLLREKIKAIHSKYEEKIQKVFEDEEFESFGGFVYDTSQSVQDNMLEIVTDLNEELESQKDYFKENPNSINAWLYQSNITDLRKLVTKIRNFGKDLENSDFPELLKFAELDVKEKLGYKDTLLYMFLHSEVFGLQNTQKFEYCVVDEAQDLSLLEYTVLSKFVLRGRLCILGDLNQSIREEGLSKWDEIYEVVTEAKNANIFELDTNYRSTKQIIDLANSILSPYTQKYLPKSINRIGIEPVVKEFGSTEDMVSFFSNSIETDLKDLDKSIGVICFDETSFNKAKTILNNIKTKEEIIILDENKPIHYIPKGVYLTTFDNCKGLEFSKVYVLNLRLSKISSFFEAKRAFVAVTRAMNELEVYASE